MHTETCAYHRIEVPGVECITRVDKRRQSPLRSHVVLVLGAELLEHYAISVALEEGTLSVRTLH